MKIHGHPWSINTRKTLMTLAEKGHEATLALVMLPKGEHKRLQHLALHPFGKVPVLEDEDLILYETHAIDRYLDAKLPGPRLVPASPREAARVDQWIGIADSYLVPHAHPVVVELLFRRYLGGERNDQAVATGRAGLPQALDVADAALASSPHLAGSAFTLADIHWMPYVEYLERVAEGEAIARRPHLAAWWKRVSERPTWQRVA